MKIVTPKSPHQPLPGPPQSTENRDASYGQIIKSTALVSAASGIDIVQRIVRTKVIAVLLGPSGVGIMGVYTSITWVASTIAGVGISNSGVRQIAEAVATGDQKRIARTVQALNRTTWFLGLIGAGLMALLCSPISRFTFGKKEHSAAIALLAVSILFTTVTNGFTAYIQGIRRISDLARVNIISGISGTLLGLPLIWIWGSSAIIPLLLVSSGAALIISWSFAARSKAPKVSLPWNESLQETRVLLGLGMAFMASGLMNALLPYLTRTMVLRKAGLEGAGHYSAAYTLAAIYSGFILQAMGADFFPRLTGASQDNKRCNRMVNEQAEISLLLAMPGLLATLALAPWVIRIFYAGNFEPAIGILRWQALGALCRVGSWPMGFILLAKGDRRLFLLTELALNITQVLFLIIGLHFFGLPGTGMAFFAGNLFYWIMIYQVTRRTTGFSWSSENMHLAAWMLPLVAVTFFFSLVVPPFWSQLEGIAVTALCSYFCLRILVRKVPNNRVARLLSQFF